MTTASSGSTCRIYLVRHGQTTMNVEVRYRGRLDVPLNEVGLREAREAAAGLADKGISAIYSSPLRRARQVAHAIELATEVSPVRLLPELVNLEYGRWEGLTKDECDANDAAQWDLYCNDPERSICPGGEGLADAADRVMSGLKMIARAHPAQAVAAVSHGIMLRFAVLRLRGMQDGVDWQFKMPTGGALVFDVEPNTGEIELVVGPEQLVPEAETVNA